MNSRPMPPTELLDSIEPYQHFAPAPDVEEWMRATFIEPDGALSNEDHAHLRDAVLGVIWTTLPYGRQMREVVGMAEMPVFRAGAWQKGRQEQQIAGWFGVIPDFLITLSAPFAAQASDAVFCALVEHELYHCAHAFDRYGMPAFTKEGRPKFAMRGHDVEEFVGVVRRYGAGASDSATARLVEAANNNPEVARIDIARACGTCALKAA